MKEKILIVEDKFVEADYLRLMLTKAGYGVTGIAHSVIQARELIKEERPDLVLLDIFLKGNLTGIDLATELGKDNIAFVYLSANSNVEVLNMAKATQPYGFLIKPFRERDLLITLEIARYRHVHSMESNFRKESGLRDKLSAIAADTESWEKKLLAGCRAMQPYIPFDYAAAGFNAGGAFAGQGISFLRIGYDEYQQIGIPELLNITGLNSKALMTLLNNTAYDPTPTLYNGNGFEQACIKPSLHKLFYDNFQVRSCLSMPLHLSNGEVFVISFYSRQPDLYNGDHLGLLSRLNQLMSVGIENIFHTARSPNTEPSKNRNVPVPAGGSGITTDFEGIIGKSPRLLNIFDLITQVAPVDTSVLILGESGTGKERVADCIHQLSARKNKPFVKVNCAALPPTLIESELFGHEKGSFTGATDRRIGKFEKADKGTIFLDEIGEMPLDLQVKLLRVLQEKYIERIGGRDVTRVDVRVIAATNRNLEKEVAEGRFRLDLYYRLNVFPMELPPLRERSEDIPALASHFISIYNRKAGKRITGISEKALKIMMAYNWPGNIRQLENLIERSVLLTKGSIIEDISIPALQRNDIPAATSDTHMKTIHENERDYIILVLKKCKGKIWGSGGAAELLNLPPTTLKSKMKKLGIRKENIEWT
ncbi:MAG TPA: sigma 54-interacting transcriptional regulator [Puia sp.]|jgi:DNA-binding NtrC family response regulator